MRARKGETITKSSPLFTSAYRRSEPKERIGTDLIRKTLVRASKRTGLKFSPHDLGGFTQTQLENVGIAPNWIRKICGHKIRGEESPYSRPKIEKLREAYKNAIPYLTTEIEESEPQLEESLKKELQLLRDILNPLQPMLEFAKPFKSADAMKEFLQAIKERSTTARQRAKEEHKLQKAPTIVDLEKDDILQAAIQATKEEYRKNLLRKKSSSESR